MSEEAPKSHRSWNICGYSVIFVLLAVILVPFLNFCGHFCHKEREACVGSKEKIYSNVKNLEPRPKFILYDGINRTDILSAVNNVLQRLGLEKINKTYKHPPEFPQDWNLLWTFKHFEGIKQSINFSTLKYHQKINHFPGNYLLVSKSFLSTQNDFDFIPKGFLNADDVRKYAAEHPEKRFVMKLKSNRGVKLVRPEEMNFTATNSIQDYFAQEYLEDPLLWHGYKFDFSIFVAITSVNPLRVYYYNKNVNLRFCLKPYDTSNVSDVDSYVIGTQHTSGQSFPYVKNYIEAGYTYRDAFEGFIKEIGGDVDDIWRKVENLIRSVVLTKEKEMINGIKRFGATKYNFFELYRFDMIFDKNLKLYLIEVNMSPNILATKNKAHNKFMFENVLYNLFNMIGVGTFYTKSHFTFPDYGSESMVVYHDAFTIKPEICLKTPCLENCDDEACKYCWKCLERNVKYEMIQAYNEQMNRGHFTRLFPVGEDKIGENLQPIMTDVNKYYMQWFHELCKKNKNFC